MTELTPTNSQVPIRIIRYCIQLLFLDRLSIPKMPASIYARNSLAELSPLISFSKIHQPAQAAHARCLNLFTRHPFSKYYHYLTKISLKASHNRIQAI